MRIRERKKKKGAKKGVNEVWSFLGFLVTIEVIRSRDGVNCWEMSFKED